MNNGSDETAGLTHQRLKSKQRSLREGFPENLGLRVHRALSWLERAEDETEGDDAAFIFLWISFNAAYAEDTPDASMNSERSVFNDFFSRIVEMDSDNRIYSAIWERFSESIRIILQNKFIFQPFWSHHNGLPGNEDWAERFEASTKVTQRALSNRDTAKILSVLFDRLYVLRNQVFHGGATWRSSVNRGQISDGVNILAFLVPLFLDLMMDHPDVLWGPPNYPVVE